MHDSRRDSRSKIENAQDQPNVLITGIRGETMVLRLNEKHVNKIHKISLARAAITAALCIGIIAQTFCPAAANERESVIWLEAEKFQNCAGWSNDSQFVDLMGSPYLLAASLGKPVADATTVTQIQSSGEYRLWVRCKDWLPSHSPGRFQVYLGHNALPPTLARADDDSWHWVDGGTFHLEKGPVQIRLHDLTGWWGRCDAIVLESAGFKPSDDPLELARQREKYGGLSPEISDMGTGRMRRSRRRRSPRVQSRIHPGQTRPRRKRILRDFNPAYGLHRQTARQGQCHRPGRRILPPTRLAELR
jgi:hypothetical protein